MKTLKFSEFGMEEELPCLTNAESNSVTNVNLFMTWKSADKEETAKVQWKPKNVPQKKRPEITNSPSIYES
jgi:hypothetical protein